MAFSRWLITASLGAIALISIYQAASPGDKSKTEKKPNPPVPIQDMPKGPIALFEDACARCHGPFGSFYGEEFAVLEGGELELVVFDMMIGPSQLNVSDTEIEAMIAYHRALREEALFVSVNNGQALKNEKAEAIYGDKLPNTQVVIHKDGNTYHPDEEKITWQLKPALAPPFQVEVKRNHRSASFVFPQRQWTLVKAIQPEEGH